MRGEMRPAWKNRACRNYRHASSRSQRQDKSEGEACWHTADGQQSEVKEVGWRGRLAARGERRLAGWVTADEQRDSRIDNSA